MLDLLLQFNTLSFLTSRYLVSKIYSALRPSPQRALSCLRRQRSEQILLDNLFLAFKQVLVQAMNALFLSNASIYT